jgi:anti-sigma factor RsiW
MTCGEMDMLVHPFIDGELVDEERVRIEKHAAGCERCRGLVNHEVTFRQNLRARLRPRAGHDTVPPELRQRVVAALDRADAEGEGPARSIGRRFAPALGALATAAAIALFFGSHGDGGNLGRSSDGLVEQAIAGHRKNLPVEVGGTDAEITSWMQGKVPVAVRPLRRRTADSASPSMMGPNPRAMMIPRLVGARISHLGNRDAGQIVYRVEGSQLTVYVFDPSGWEVSAPSQRHQMIDGREVYLAERAGYSVAIYRDRGVGYALASDLDEDSLLAVVAAALQEDARR